MPRTHLTADEAKSARTNFVVGMFVMALGFVLVIPGGASAYIGLALMTFGLGYILGNDGAWAKVDLLRKKAEQAPSQKVVNL